MSFQQVSALQGSSSGSIFNTFQQQSQQNASPDVKFNLCVHCVQHVAVSVHSAHHRQHSIWGQDQIWIKEEQNVVDTYTSLIITTHELWYHYTNKNVLYFYIQ